MVARRRAGGERWWVVGVREKRLCLWGIVLSRSMASTRGGGGETGAGQISRPPAPRRIVCAFEKRRPSPVARAPSRAADGPARGGYIHLLTIHAQRSFHDSASASPREWLIGQTFMLLSLAFFTFRLSQIPQPDFLLLVCLGA